MLGAIFGDIAGSVAGALARSIILGGKMVSVFAIWGRTIRISKKYQCSYLAAARGLSQ